MNMRLKMFENACNVEGVTLRDGSTLTLDELVTAIEQGECPRVERAHCRQADGKLNTKAFASLDISGSYVRLSSTSGYWMVTFGILKGAN